jgi:hypothetical protein
MEIPRLLARPAHPRSRAADPHEAENSPAVGSDFLHRPESGQARSGQFSGGILFRRSTTITSTGTSPTFSSLSPSCFSSAGKIVGSPSPAGSLAAGAGASTWLVLRTAEGWAPSRSVPGNQDTRAGPGTPRRCFQTVMRNHVAISARARGEGISSRKCSLRNFSRIARGFVP